MLVAALAAVLTLVTAAVGLAAVVQPANSGGLVAVGPTSAANGFPVWYTDANDTTLELCLDGRDPLCGLLPEDGYDPTQPTAFPGNFPGEAFWYLGESSLATSFEQGDGEALVLFGLEAAFAVDEVRDGDQITFGRIRIRVDTAAAGTYTVEHPYGVDRFEAAAGERAINYTEDIGIGAPGDFTGALKSRVGPFLRWDTGAPAGYVGDPNVAHTVTGSPVGTDFVRITGPGVGQGSPDQCAGDELPAGGLPADCIYSDLFSIMGKEAVNFGVEAERAAYARTSTDGGSLEVYAHSFPGEQIQVAGIEGVMPATPLRGNAAGDYFAVVPFTGEVPETVTVQNIGDAPVSESAIPVHDAVTIDEAYYDDAARTLTVRAVSGDAAVPPTLTVPGLGALDAAGNAVFADVAVPPLPVAVTSSAGGGATRVATTGTGGPPPPATPPGSPTITSATPGDESINVIWTPPSGGAEVTGYLVQAVAGDTTVQKTATGTDTSAMVTGLTNGTPYTVRVAATGPTGTSAFAELPEPVTPAGAGEAATVPGPPTGVTATPGDASATVSWTAPADDGGAQLSGYTVEAFTGGASAGTTTVDGNTTSVTVTDLVPGQEYTFTVAAANAKGAGPASEPSAAVTPTDGGSTPVGTAPAAPTGVTATPGDASARVSWAAPADGGSPITGYTVRVLTDGATVDEFGVGDVLETDVTGLTNGTAYAFQVAAVNANGTGAFSDASAPVTPAAPAPAPGSPTITSTTAGPESMTVTWTAPADNGATVTGYRVDAVEPGGAVANSTTAEPTATSATVTGLDPATAYTMRVVALSGAVEGMPAQSAPVTPLPPVTVPEAPAIGTASAGPGGATVTWTAPADGGSAITGYTVQALQGDTVAREVPAAAGATIATVTGLTNGTTYTLRVAATNAAGTGAFSAPSNAVTPRTTPGAPGIGTVTAGNGQATLTWTAPVDDGGSAITGYTVQAVGPDGAVAGNPVTAAADARSATVGGLVNGTAYTLRVAATNAAGSGASATSRPVTPATVPGVPTNVTARSGPFSWFGTASVIAGWTAPTSNGGSPVTGYVVTATSGGHTVTKTVAATLRDTEVTGLNWGSSYTVTVRAVNAVGSSAPSAPSGGAIAW